MIGIGKDPYKRLPIANRLPLTIHRCEKRTIGVSCFQNQEHSLLAKIAAFIKKVVERIAAFFKDAFCGRSSEKKLKLQKTEAAPAVSAVQNQELPFKKSEAMVIPKKQNTQPKISDRKPKNQGPSNVKSHTIIPDASSKIRGPGPIGLPKGVFSQAASFLDPISLIQLSQVNKQYQREATKQQRILRITPENIDFFEKLTDPVFQEKYEKIEELVFDGQRVTFDEALVAKIISAAKKGALPNLKRIFYSSFSYQKDYISEKDFISFVQVFPKLQYIDLFEAFDYNMCVDTGVARDERYTKQVTQALADHCPDLRVVRFPNPVRFHRSTPITPQELGAFLDKWPLLEVIHFPENFTDAHLEVIGEKCSNLQGISFPTFFNPVTAEAMIRLMNRCKKLKRMDLQKKDWVYDMLPNLGTHCKGLKELNLLAYPGGVDKAMVQALVNSPPSLTALSLKDCSDLTDEDLNSLLEKLPDLEVFSLDLALHHANISDAVLDSLGKKCPKLKKVHFGHINCDFTQKGFLELIKKMPNIESLTIPCYEENYDELLITIAEHCPHLRELTVYGSGHVGRDVLKRFGEKCSKLQSLDTNITIRDEAVNYVPRTYFPKLVNYSQFAAHALFPEYRTSHYGFFNEGSWYF